MADGIHEAGVRDDEVRSLGRWSRRNQMLIERASTLCSTLFWAGNTFAPHHIVDDPTSIIHR